MKAKLTKSDWEKLTPAVQELYEEQDGAFVLPIEGDGREDIGPLKRALERVKSDLDAERTAREEAERKINELDENDAVKRGDIDKLTQQWEKKLSDQTQQAQEREASLRKYIEKREIDAVVREVATRNTSSKENADLLDPHLRKNLAVEFKDDGTPQVMQITEAGPVPLDAEKFEKSVVDNPAYKAIIVENRASGGDASGTSDSGQGGGAFQTENHGHGSGNTPMLAEIDPEQLAKIVSKR